MTEHEQTSPPEWPPDWWDLGPNGGTADGPRPGGVDLAPLLALVDALRRAVPPELQEQFNALVREVLLTIRALIDWYLERIDGPRREPEVEDIPID